MRAVSPEDVRRFLGDYVRRNMRAQGRDLPVEFSEDCDLLLSGLIDSLGLLELTTAISAYCEGEIDFEALDPEQMTIVGPLCRFVSEQTVKS
jgi:acyl carrier protein